MASQTARVGVGLEPGCQQASVQVSKGAWLNTKFCDAQLRSAMARAGGGGLECLRAMRERFRQAERRGWFFPGSAVTKYPLSGTGVSLEGKPPKKQPGERNYGRAAVLFLIGCKESSHQPQVLITKRSTDVGSHPGIDIITSQ